MSSEATANGHDPATRTYRFAFYGRAASGKTNLLAALAMPRTPHPREVSCTWVPHPQGVLPPQGDPADWDLKDRAVGILLGREWLEEAIKQLSSGEVPVPNKANAVLRFAYEFSTPTRRPYRVELIDYSGELVDPKMTNDELALRLAEHLRQMDALFVLAEMPLQDTAQPKLPGELLKLEQAFATLAAEHVQGAASGSLVALLINKWDRRGRVNDALPESTSNAAQEFLFKEEGASHRALANASRNAVGHENFHAFAVSAFGEHVVTQTESGLLERPRQVMPLKSFGLLEPLEWAAVRCDQMALESHAADVARLNPWAFWQTQFGRNAAKFLTRGRLLAARFLDGSEEHLLAKQINRRYRGLLALHLSLAVTILLVCVLLAQCGWEARHYHRAEAALKDPRTSDQAYSEAESWLKSYAVAPTALHPLAHLFVLSRAEAEQRIVWAAQNKETQLWETVKQASEGLPKADRARNYIASFPGGKHAPEAKSLVADVEQIQQRQANDEMIKQAEIAFLRLGSTPKEQSLMELSKDLTQPPYPAAITDEFLQARDALRGRITAALKRIQTLDLARQYEDLMTTDDLLGAARLLTEAEPKRPELNQDFQKRVIGIVERQINDDLAGRQWVSARELYEKIHHSAAIEQLIDAEETRSLNDLSSRIDVAEDRSRYEEVGKYRDLDHVNNYLNNAPLKTMQGVVVTYRQYLDAMAGPLDLTLNLTRIDWGSKWDGYKNDIVVSIDGKKIIDKTDVVGVANGMSGQVDCGKFNARWSTPVTVDVKIVRQKWWIGVGSTMDAGQYQFSTTPESLRGRKVQLRSSQQQENAVTFDVTGEPSEPPLPPWGGS